MYVFERSHQWLDNVLIAFKVFANVKTYSCKAKESFIFIIFEVEYDLTRLVADRYLRCTVSRQSNVAEGAGLFSESNQRKMAIIV